MNRLWLLLVVPVVTAPALAAYDVAAVQRAIREQGKRWTAGETALTRLRDEERARCTLRHYPFPAGFALPEGGWREPPRPAVFASVTDVTFSWADQAGLCYMTPVRDQGHCGSCFVFGSIAVTEAQYRIVRGEPGLDIDLAEQELISCISVDDCATGGTAEQVGAYLKANGVPDEACFPYTSGTTGSDGQCSASCADGSEQRFFIRDWDMSTLPWSTDELKAQLLIAPIIANMQVYDDFYAYQGGVYERTTDDVSGWHIVALIGWDDQDDSWIVKNSWGTDWGLQGYAKIARGERACVPTYPLGYFDGTCFASHTTTFEITRAETGEPGTDAGLVTTDAAVSSRDSATPAPDAAPRPDAATAPDAARPDSAVHDAGSAAGDRGSPDQQVVGVDVGAADAASGGVDAAGAGAPDPVGGGCACAGLGTGFTALAWLIAGLGPLGWRRRRR